MLASRPLSRISQSSAINYTAPRFPRIKRIPPMTTLARFRLFSSVHNSHVIRSSGVPSMGRHFLISPSYSIRFQSTSSAGPTGTIASSDAVTPGFEPFDSLSPLIETQKVIPEDIGFLHELGLNFGWGPTSCMQWYLEHVHIWSGTPWWASIVIATLVIRLVQLPGYLKLSDISGRMREVQPFATPIMNKLQSAYSQKNIIAAHAAKSELGALYAKAGINRLWLVFPIAQIPIFLGFYKLLHAMAGVPVPGLLNGGTLWITNLSIPDPSMALPLSSSISLALGLYLGGADSGNVQIGARMRKALMIGLPCVSMFVMYSWPSAVTLYFATSSVFGVTQSLILRNPNIREALGLWPMQPNTPAPPPLIPANITPEKKPAGLRSIFAAKMNKMIGTETGTTTTMGSVMNAINSRAKQSKHSAYENKKHKEMLEKKKELIEYKKKLAVKDRL